eukprot:184673-Chlamydomonas_euryale.AAC.1
MNILALYVACILIFWLKNVKPLRRQLSKYQPNPKVAPACGKGAMSGEGGLGLGSGIGEVPEGAVGLLVNDYAMSAPGAFPPSYPRSHGGGAQRGTIGIGAA